MAEIDSSGTGMPMAAADLSVEIAAPGSDYLVLILCSDISLE